MKDIESILSRILSKKINYNPLIEVRIFRDALLHNLNEYQSRFSSLKFAPVLKSNAYGHGMAEVAKILDKVNYPPHPPIKSGAGSSPLPPGERENCIIPFFMVDSFYEALVLRREGVKTKILVLGYCREEQLLSVQLKNVSFGIIDLRILKLTKPLNVQLKIDTGMHRQGILISEVSEAIVLVKQNKNIILEGVCTHFADADGSTEDFTQKQIESWNNTVNIFKKDFPEIKYFHASNSAGAHYANKVDANISRLGIGLYGVNPSPFVKLDLQPALEMVSIISSIKNITPGEKVGYGITFKAEKPMTLATVPVGYNEGVDRRLSNIGFYKVGVNFCPLVGRVSMNMSSIDVTAVKEVNLEQEVIVISKNKEDKNSMENMAKLCGCIPWEILVHIPQHLRRTVI